MTPSTSRGWRLAVLRRTSWMQCAASSSGRVRLNDPRNDLASAVRELATMTASLMKSPNSLSPTGQALGRRNQLFVDFCERLTRFSQALQKRRRFPGFSVLLMEFANALADLLQPHRVGIPHRNAPVAWKSIAVEIAH